MSFTDDDLKQLKGNLRDKIEHEYLTFTRLEIKALLARLEAAEDVASYHGDTNVPVTILDAWLASKGEK